ncbi:MAG: MerR family DNA-binding transcriptional regulator [Lachnospiraceae bacterium]|nr:MerR family DNA-binding transcriptional regulator [Lachnospiraceae bacterium]
MLKIGDFSKLSRVSIRMLRHYDDIGLLKPAEIYDDKDKLDDFLIARQKELAEQAKETEVASCIVKGSYDQMSDSPMFCIYHVSPAMTSNPDEYVTEVCFPVERS